MNWDDSSKKITTFKDNKTVSLVAGEKVAYKDGQPVQLDVPAKIIKGRTMVPVRFISEALSNEVIWKQDSRFVAIRTLPQMVWIKKPELNQRSSKSVAPSRLPFWVTMDIYSSGNPNKGLGLAPYDVGQDIMIQINLTYTIDTPDYEAYFKTETLNVIEYSPYITITGPKDVKVLEIELPTFKGPMKPGEEYYIRYFWDQKDKAGKQLPAGAYSFDLDWLKEPHGTVLRYSDENGNEYTQDDMTPLGFIHKDIEK